jgi:hypothetical protein
MTALLRDSRQVKGKMSVKRGTYAWRAHRQHLFISASKYACVTRQLGWINFAHERDARLSLFSKVCSRM